MSNTQDILDIMENTIESLGANKENVLAIIQNLQNEYKRKKEEFNNIKEKLPKLMEETTRLQKQDKELRKELMTASHNFSEEGHQNLKYLFEQASNTHAQLFKAEEVEQTYVRRRNDLELELKQMEANIKLAESMAQQLITSLSYLQTGINDLKKSPNLLAEAPSLSECDPILTAFRCIEGEKSRIARDLHDGPTQRIASVQMRMDFCKTAIKIDLEKGLSLLDHLKQDLANTLSEVRAILFDLNPAPLEKLGLKSSIEHLLYNASDKLQLKVNYSYKIEEMPLSQSLQSTIYRTIQELINNVKKHAEATAINLSLHSAQDHIYINFEDNGIGFTVPEDLEIMYAQKRSYGLFNIYTRVTNLNGLLKINSSKNKGSEFKIQLPILLT